MKTLPEKKLKRAVFFDRDGVLNKKSPEHDYVKNHGEFVWNGGARELIKEINRLGFLVIVLSNQRGIARGMMTAGFVDELHARMNEDLAKIGAHIDAFYYCPHSHEDECQCRKPLPGMFFKAAAEWGIDLKKSFAVGDSESDLTAGAKAGCRNIKVETDSIRQGAIISSIRDS